MPYIRKEVGTFYLEIFELIFIALNITQLNFNDHSSNNNNNAINTQIDENIMIEQNSNNFQLYEDFEEDMDDETATKNVNWRKDYFDFLENGKNNSEINEMSTNIENFKSNKDII